MFISTYLFIKLFLEHWDGADPGVFAVHSNEWKLRGKLWHFMFIGQMTLEKLTSVSATARPKYILLLYILFHFPSGNIALHCTALEYLSSVLNSILKGQKTFRDIQKKCIVVKVFIWLQPPKSIHFMLYLWATTPFYLPLLSIPKSWQQDQDPTLSRPLRWRGT